MKFEEININKTPTVLDEVKMTTSVYDQFINSGDAEGIKAGFEAELIFTGMSDSSSGTDYDAEPEMDESNDTRADSIDEICDFFYDGEYNGRREIQALRETLEDEYAEWRNQKMSEDWSEAKEEKVREYIEENDWNFEEMLEGWMDNEMELTPEAISAAMEWTSNRITSSRQEQDLIKNDQSFANFAEARDAVEQLLEEKVQEALDNEDSNYDSARDEWESDNEDDYTDDVWLAQRGRPWMTDLYREYDVQWPYWEYPEREQSEGGFSEDNAIELARDLRRQLGFETKVASGYHSATRKPNLWIFEPDGSLEADDDDDMPVEIVSPPMDLAYCLKILPEFFKWAKSHGAYSNESTGFHIGVSLPNVGGHVDYVKLALFLGDQHVLDEFGRGSNYFAKSALGKLKDDVSTGKVGGAQVADTLKLMKSNLIELANKTLKSGKGEGFGHGKYTSINMKGDYIEFRSMGSESYFSNPDSLNKALDTIKRYAYAMYIASRPDLYREEYAKKLYKLLDTGENSAAIMQEFSEYVAGIGGADAKTVKNVLYSIKSDQYKDAPLPDRQTPARSGAKTGKYWWNVRYNGQRMEVVATDKREARDAAAKEWGLSLEQRMSITGADITPLKPFQNSPGGIGNWAILANGVQVFRVTASNQGEANQKAREWLSSTSREFRLEHEGQEFDVVPV